MLGLVAELGTARCASHDGGEPIPVSMFDGKIYRLGEVTVNTSRENAPLVELIAELRWNPLRAPEGQVQAGGLGPTFVATNPNQFDQFFMQFAGAIHGAGYTQAERLVPPGFPIMGQQPVYRFKEAAQGSTSSLYQVGPGVFTANAVPPYESWTQFGPVVEKGVRALLRARLREEADAPFFATNLRYIDAFGPALTEGRDIGRFVKEVLGIDLAIPKALTQHLQSGSAAKPSLQFQIPMANGMLMTLSIGEGAVNGQMAILMDTSVATTIDVQPNVEAVMAAFNHAQASISDSFLKLIGPILHLMPTKGGNAA